MKEQNTNNQALVTETMDGNLVMLREPIMGKDGKQMVTKDGRPYFAYVVRGRVQGREIKVDFCPKDQGGYEPLDILFDMSPKMRLVMSEETMTDDNGRETHYTAYRVEYIDADGEIWPCAVRPQRDSDKTLLKFLLIELGKTKTNTVA